MNDSFWTRLWNAIKPPPAVPRKAGAPRGLNPNQKRLLWGSVSVVILIVGVWQVSAYIASAPMRAQKVYEQGMAQMTPGHYGDAVKLFSKATEIYPQLSEAYLERGNAQKILGEMEGALADYDKAIEMGNLPAAYTARGRIYLSRGDANRAEQDFTRSIGVEPTSDAYYQLGQVREAVGDHEHAILNYDQAIHIQPDAPFIYEARAAAKRAKGDEDGAKADRDEAYEITHRIKR